MLDFIYYPVSAILWFWHTVFGAIHGPDNGDAWAQPVVFLVCTLRTLLLKPAIKQVRTTRQMQELGPQIKALQKKYAGDRARQATEMQKLQKEHGFNPLMGCLPALVQAPVFIGLYHVLRSFNRTGTGLGQLGMSPEANAHTANYIFSATDVQSFLSA
ncbi:MAG: membrane protein insertase YidC, partial [Pseudonocardiaceae bacterium]